jgi:hypothetical protein
MTHVDLLPHYTVFSHGQYSIVTLYINPLNKGKCELYEVCGRSHIEKPKIWDGAAVHACWGGGEGGGGEGWGRGGAYGGWIPTPRARKLRLV